MHSAVLPRTGAAESRIRTLDIQYTQSCVENAVKKDVAGTVHITRLTGWKKSSSRWMAAHRFPFGWALSGVRLRAIFKTLRFWHSGGLCSCFMTGRKSSHVM